MGQLADQAFDRAALEAAWTEVRSNECRDPVPNPGLRAFANRADERLDALAATLSDQTYRPGFLRRILIPGASGERILDIPRVTDRIVARAMLEVLTPIVDPLFGPFSYAYRPGLGVADAVQAVVALREEGMGWVVRTDVNDCFPSIPRETVRSKLFPLLGGDRWLVRVIRLMLKRRSVIRRRRFYTSGLPQGCALSPMLANLVLADLDAHLSAHGFPSVRYSDDIVIAGHTPADCASAIATAARFLEGLGMTLGDDKTEIMSFEEGFAFLGEDFGSRYPALAPDHRADEPDSKVVYAGSDGARVRHARGRVIVESRDEATLLDVARSQVGRLVCFGAVGISAGARNSLLSKDVDIVLASRRGTYLGSITSGRSGPRADRIRAQVALAGTPRALMLSRAIVKAKLTKQLVLLRRFTRPDCVAVANQAVTGLQALLTGLHHAETPQALMGSEGAAARAYFAAFGQMLPNEVQFAIRSRQPPRDIANAAMSYLYAILLGECVTALHAAGLEPSLGVLHADDSDRPSLALDLMEEFRPLIADQVVMRLARQRALTAAHGTQVDGEGVYLTQEGKSVVVTAYELRMLQVTRGALPEFAGTLRRHLYRQAHRLRAVITDPSVEWSGLSWR